MIGFYGSVELRPLSKVLDRTKLGNSFKDITFFIPFHVQVILVVLEIICKIKSFNFFH